MATCEGCCHLTVAMLNLAAEAADRARIESVLLADGVKGRVLIFGAAKIIANRDSSSIEMTVYIQKPRQSI
jgi:hypothetical protein